MEEIKNKLTEEQIEKLKKRKKLIKQNKEVYINKIQ